MQKFGVCVSDLDFKFPLSVRHNLFLNCLIYCTVFNQIIKFNRYDATIIANVKWKPYQVLTQLQKTTVDSDLFSEVTGQEHVYHWHYKSSMSILLV